MSDPRLIAVTGGNGFVGRHFSRYARARGFRVRQLSRRSADQFDPADEIYPFSLDAEAHPDEMLRGCDVLVHLAAHIPQDHQDSTEAGRCWQTNALGSLRLAEAAARAGIGHFVQTCSANAYAATDTPPDEDAAMFPISRVYYLGSKILQDIYVGDACRRAAMDYAVLRVSAVYGAGQAPNVITRFIDAIQHGRSIRLTGKGSYGADFVHVDDVVMALILTITKDVRGALNVGSGTRTTMMGLATTLVDLLGRNADLIELDRQAGKDPGFPALDIGRLRSMGLEPRPLIAGLRDMTVATQIQRSTTSR